MGHGAGGLAGTAQGVSRSELITRQAPASSLASWMGRWQPPSERGALARRIQALDTEREALMSDLEALTQATCPGLRRSYGIGVNGAAVQLAAVGHHPERIRSETAFAVLLAASPLEASFSNTRHHGLNRGGHRQANVTLHRLAVVRLRWHEQTKAYAERRKAEGRSNKDIRRCLKRFIARGCSNR